MFGLFEFFPEWFWSGFGFSCVFSRTGLDSRVRFLPKRFGFGSDWGFLETVQFHFGLLCQNCSASFRFVSPKRFTFGSVYLPKTIRFYNDDFSLGSNRIRFELKWLNWSGSNLVSYFKFLIRFGLNSIFNLQRLHRCGSGSVFFCRNPVRIGSVCLPWK